MLKKIAVLVSSSGTNLQAIIDTINEGDINGKIEVVISNNNDAYALKRAKKENIDTYSFSRKDGLTSKDINEKILCKLKEYNVDLVVLAGFLHILDANIISNYKNKIINVHPSLIPSFCGKGYYGEKVHKACIEYGVKVSGATVHFVDSEIDSGAIIFQEIVHIEEDDNHETLKNKVLRVEHKLLTKAIKEFCNNNINIIGRKVVIK